MLIHPEGSGLVHETKKPMVQLTCTMMPHAIIYDPEEVRECLQPATTIKHYA